MPRTKENATSGTAAEENCNIEHENTMSTELEITGIFSLSSDAFPKLRCKPLAHLVDENSTQLGNFNFEDNILQVDIKPSILLSPCADGTSRAFITPSKKTTRKKSSIISVKSSDPESPIKKCKTPQKKFQLKGNYRKMTDFFNSTPKKNQSEGGQSAHTAISIKDQEQSQTSHGTPSTSVLESKPIPQARDLKTSAKSSVTIQYIDSKSIQPKTKFEIKRKLCPNTDLRKVSKRYLNDGQKQLDCFFTSAGEKPAGYYQTYKYSHFPVLISGNVDVDDFLNLLMTGDTLDHFKCHYDRKSHNIVLEPGTCDMLEDQLMLKVENALKELDSATYIKEVVEKENATVPATSKVPLTRGQRKRQKENDPLVEATEQDKKEVDFIEISSDSNDSDFEPKSKSVARKKKVKTKVSHNKKPKKIPVVPSYKIIRGTKFAVDAFRYGEIEGVTHYFLTHFHADHYVGLTKKFSHPVYLSHITANLVRRSIGVDDKYLREIDLNEPVTVGDVEVTALDANHCPGAVMFVFKLPSGECLLHVGDFRASPEMENEQLFWNNHIDCIYLDTTYLATKGEMPSQMEAVDNVLRLVDEYREQHIGMKYLIVIGTYVVGKEKVWSAIARHCNYRVWLEKSRQTSVECYEDSTLLSLLEVDPLRANIHVLPLANVHYSYLTQYMDQYDEQFTHVLAIRPSGWERNSRPQKRGNITIHGVAYSEHSSYEELKRFVRFIKPDEVISTVPVRSGSKMPTVPPSWLTKEVVPARRGYQHNITNYMDVKRKKEPKCGDESAVIEKEPVDVSQDLAMCSMQVERNSNIDSDTDWMI